VPSHRQLGLAILEFFEVEKKRIVHGCQALESQKKEALKLQKLVFWCSLLFFLLKNLPNTCVIAFFPTPPNILQKVIFQRELNFS
jgi:hypothetical protein